MPDILTRELDCKSIVLLVNQVAPALVETQTGPFVATAVKSWPSAEHEMETQFSLAGVMACFQSLPMLVEMKMKFVAAATSSLPSAEEATEVQHSFITLSVTQVVPKLVEVNSGQAVPRPHAQITLDPSAEQARATNH
jgi:hypothetical protein